MLTNKGDNLLDTLSNYNLKQMINSPTHFQGNPTLIDVVFVNDVIIHKTRVIECPESNHCYILTLLNLKPNYENLSAIKTRVNEDILLLIKESVKLTNFSSINYLKDIND